jgi:hypothetical protein
MRSTPEPTYLYVVLDCCIHDFMHGEMLDDRWGLKERIGPIKDCLKAGQDGVENSLHHPSVFTTDFEIGKEISRYVALGLAEDLKMRKPASE